MPFGRGNGFGGTATAAADGDLSVGGLDRIDAFLRDATGPGGHLGAVALIAHQGRPVRARAYGHRDLARRQPMQADTIFRIYSMTKPVASVALLMLVEDGRVALDDAVSRHLPQFADVQVLAGGSANAPVLRAPVRPMTIRHLLTHTAGLATGGPGMEQALRLLEGAELPRAASLDDFVRRLAGVPLGDDPGARFNYDGVNTEVLSRIVEVASGAPFDAVLRDRIFGPLGMRDTGFSVPPGQRGRIADLSTIGADGRLALAATRSAAAPGEPLNAYLSGAGGLYSTGPDYLRFCRMLLAGGSHDGARLLRPQTVALMTANQLPQLHPAAGPVVMAEIAPGEGFGFGVSVIIDPARRSRPGSAGAYGWLGAASTWFTVDPKEQMIAILLLQHLPGHGAARDLPRPGAPFFALVDQALKH